MKWMQRIYKAKNGVTEVTRFAVSDRARVRTGKDAGSPRKQEANKHQAVHRLARILNNNFQEHDLFLSLTYSESAFRRMRSEAYATLPKGRKEKKEVKRDAVLARAEQDGKDFIKLLRKLGADVSCYVSVPSDMDGDTGKEERPHVHLIIKGESFALIKRKLTVCGQPLEELWGKGIVLHEFLRKGSYNKIAGYLLQQTRDIPHRRRYACAKGMERVIPEEMEIVLGKGDPIPVPAGAQVQERIQTEGGYGMQYVRYIEPDADPLAAWERQKKQERRKKCGQTSNQR